MERKSKDKVNVSAICILLIVILFVCVTSCKSKKSKLDMNLKSQTDTLITEAEYEDLFKDANLNGRFYFSEDSNLIGADLPTFNLMNKIMQMSVAMPDRGADDNLFKWYWAKACSKEILSYLRTTTKMEITNLNDKDVDMSLKNILSLIEGYEGGGQQEMTAYAFVSSILTSYRVVKAYQDRESSYPNKNDKLAIFNEFAAWKDLVSEIMTMFSEKIQGDETYSADQMDYNYAYGALYECRFDELRQEIDIISGNKTFSDTTYNWVSDEDFIQILLQYENYREDDDSIDKFKQTNLLYRVFNKWIKIREVNAKLISNINIRNSYIEYGHKISYDNPLAELS